MRVDLCESTVRNIGDPGLPADRHTENAHPRLMKFYVGGLLVESSRWNRDPEARRFARKRRRLHGFIIQAYGKLP